MTRGSTVPGLLINQQGKDIGTGVMTAYIEIKTGLDNCSQVEVGNQDVFLVPDRAGLVVAELIYLGVIKPGAS